MAGHTIFTLPGLDPPEFAQPGLPDVAQQDVAAEEIEREAQRAIPGDIKGSKTKGPLNLTDDEEKRLGVLRKDAFKQFNVSEFAGFGERFFEGTNTARDAARRRQEADNFAFQKFEEERALIKEIEEGGSPADVARAFPEENLEERFGPTAFTPQDPGVGEFQSPGEEFAPQLREEGGITDPFNRRLAKAAEARALEGPTELENDALRASTKADESLARLRDAQAGAEGATSPANALKAFELATLQEGIGLSLLPENQGKNILDTFGGNQIKAAAFNSFTQDSDSINRKSELLALEYKLSLQGFDLRQTMTTMRSNAGLIALMKKSGATDEQVKPLLDELIKAVGQVPDEDIGFIRRALQAVGLDLPEILRPTPTTIIKQPGAAAPKTRTRPRTAEEFRAQQRRP